MQVNGGNVFCYSNDERFCMGVLDTSDCAPKELSLSEIADDIEGVDALGRTMGKIVDKFEL